MPGVVLQNNYMQHKEPSAFDLTDWVSTHKQARFAQISFSLMALTSRILTFAGLLFPDMTILLTSIAGSIGALSLALFIGLHRHHKNNFFWINVVLGVTRSILFVTFVVCLAERPDLRFIWGAILGTADTVIAGFNFYAATKSRTRLRYIASTHRKSRIRRCFNAIRNLPFSSCASLIMVWLPIIATFGARDVSMGLTLTFTYMFIAASIFSILSMDGFFATGTFFLLLLGISCTLRVLGIYGILPPSQYWLWAPEVIDCACQAISFFLVCLRREKREEQKRRVDAFSMLEGAGVLDTPLSRSANVGFQPLTSTH